jgi:hypothetical protein
MKPAAVEIGKGRGSGKASQRANTGVIGRGGEVGECD